jgi:hypothetical protein
VGWFALLDDYKLQISPRINHVPPGFGKMEEYDFIRALVKRTDKLNLPSNREIHPHQNAMRWHRQNIYCNQ